MQARSWAKVAAYPERCAAESSPKPETESPEAVDSGNSDHCGSPRQGPRSPGIEVTGEQLEAGIKFSWSTNPAHLLDDTSPSASDDEQASIRMEADGSKVGNSPKMPTFSLSPVVTMFSSMDDPEDTLTTGDEHLFDNHHAQPRISVADMSKQAPETSTSGQTNNFAATAPQAFGARANEQPRVSHNGQTGEDPLKMHQFDGSSHPIQASTKSSPSKSTHKPKVSLPTTPCKSIDSSASTQDTLLADKAKSKSLTPDTMDASKTAGQDNTPVTIENLSITRHTTVQDDLITNRSELSQSASSSPSRKTSPDYKGKGKEKYNKYVHHKTTDIFKPCPPHLNLSDGSDKTITPADVIREDPEKTPTFPVRDEDMLRRHTISDSNVAGPTSQDVVSRVGSTSYSAVPDDEQDWPHTSGLDYDERCAVLRSYVEAIEDLKRAQELMNASTDCADVILFTKHHLSGIKEAFYHREVILKDSSYMARVMPPPNPDGSPITMFMGTWPIAMIQKVFDFMYTHKTPGCEPPSDDLFYHMSPAWLNYHCFLLACAFECNRQKGYTTRNLRKIVELAEKQTRGSYASYQLAYWEFSQCEEALRDLVRTAFKEKGHQEAQRPMRVLVARLVAVMVPWIVRGKYMQPIMVPLWFEMKEEYLPWREMLWHYIATGEVQSPDWAWLGEPMSELQITTALSRFDAGF